MKNPQFVTEIISLRKVVKAKQETVDAIASELKEAKKELDGAYAALLDAIDEEASGQGKLGFDSSKPDGGKAA